jgi:glyceraldehyde 3-phosphate dehydrogenase
VTVRVGVNGFGRIGRNFFRAAHASGADLEIVAFNDLGDVATMAHLLKYDSVLGRFDGEVEIGDEGLVVDGKTIKALAERDPANLPWGELGVDVVLESTGFFTNADDAAKHIKGGARKVVISAPAKGEDLTVVLGVNDGDYDKDAHHIVSNASCTTNSVAPMAKVLLDEFGIEQGFMTTIHAYTTEQQLLDQIALTRKGSPDLRRMRAAPQSIIPSTTGAAKATSLVIPELKGKLDGMAMRVPIPDGSVTDLVCILEREASADEVNDAFRKAAGGPLSSIVVYTEDPIVSADIVGNQASCILDGLSTMASGRMVKVIGWYDNEWGYSCRLADVTERVAASVGEAVAA